MGKGKYYCAKLKDDRGNCGEYFMAISEDEKTLKSYLDFIDKTKSKIFILTSEQIDSLVKDDSAVIDEVSFDIGDGTIITGMDAEYISTEAEEFSSEVLKHLKYLKKKLKYFKGKKARELSNVVNEFLNEEGDDKFFRGDNEVEEDRILMKLNLNKYSKKKLRLFYEN